MKKIIFILLAAVVLYSCKDDDFPVPTALFFEEVNPVLNADGESLGIAYESTSPTLTLDKSENTDWCKVSLENGKLLIVAEKNTSIAARSASLVVKAVDREQKIAITQEGQPTSKIRILGATVSNFQPGEGIELSYDGDMGTNYHSHWSIKDETYTLIYNVETVSSLDLISYYPRKAGANGLFGEIEIYANTTSNNQYVKVMDYDCEMATTPSHIELPTSVLNPVSVKFVVLTGKNGFASCAEMEFYKKGAN